LAHYASGAKVYIVKEIPQIHSTAGQMLPKLKISILGHAMSAPADLPGSGSAGFCHFERLTWISPRLGYLHIWTCRSELDRSKYQWIWSATRDNN